MIAIMGALTEEVAGLLEHFPDAQKHEHPAFDIYHTQGHEQTLLIAQCGVGKANAAALCQSLIEQGAKQVIFTGVAAALDPSLKVADIVISTDAMYHDVDVSAMGLPKGQLYLEELCWSADEALVQSAVGAARATTSNKVVTGRIVSGDQFIADQAKIQGLHEDFQASCAEMEGAAVAQICAKNAIPFVIIRSISDGGDASASVDFLEFLPIAAQQSVGVVLGMLER